MKLSDWLDFERGRATRMAERFGVTVAAISQWRTNGVPVGRMREVSAFTESAVALDDMLPAAPCIDVAAPQAAEVSDAA